MDGQHFESGTHWELLDGLQAKCEVLIYRRTTDPDIKRTDPKHAEKDEQWERLNTFLKSELFYDPDGITIQCGINFYENPDDFRQLLEQALRERVKDILDSFADHTPPPTRLTPTDSPNVTVIEPSTWTGSPFPGLRAFEEKQEPIFFGRGRETAALIEHVSRNRLVAVVGASGSGKSSLVAAGLIPHLKAGAIMGDDLNSQDWIVLSIKPGLDPFGTLTDALMKHIPAMRPHPMEAKRLRGQFIADAENDPSTLGVALQAALLDASTWTEILLVVDQFEELFNTLLPEATRRAFIDLLTHPSPKLRVVITLRADFYHRAVSYLEKPLRTGTFTLDKPDPFALLEMIERPAERAHLHFERGLPQQIVHDTGDEPGALALMAYALDELYQMGKDKQYLTFADYKAIGRVQGAIGKRAEAVFAELEGDTEAKADLLARIFFALVSVDERGVATRQRATFDPARLPDAEYALVAAFVNARLLVSNEENHHSATLEVAHEALLRNWARLVEWIEATQDDQRLIRRLEREATLWDQRGRPEHQRPNHEELCDFHAACERLQFTVKDPLLQDFIEPEATRLWREIEDIQISHKRRVAIGDRLDDIGDTRTGIDVKSDGTPDITWLPIRTGGTITIKEQSCTVSPFYIAKYLITYAQFEAFVQAADGYQDERWWVGMPSEYSQPSIKTPPSQRANYPRSNLTWFQTVAFTRWLNHRLAGQTLPHLQDPTLPPLVIGRDLEIRLSLEWEWQWAAQNGSEQREYPWGQWDKHPRANTTEAGINDRSTAVGMYPHGAAACGTLDMAGNLWEWCLNEYQSLLNNTNNLKNRTLRGGSFSFDQRNAACRSRIDLPPGYEWLYDGGRVVCASILNL